MASYVVEGDQGFAPQVLRDPPPRAQLQKTDNHNVLVNVLVEVHPGTRRQQCLIGVERSVHPSDGHALLR